MSCEFVMMDGISVHALTRFKMTFRLSRRKFLTTTATAGAATTMGGFFMPSVSRAADRPMITHGVQSGDVTANTACLWGRADRASRMVTEIATTEGFKNSVRIPHVDVLPPRDFAGKLTVRDLPAGQDIFFLTRKYLAGIRSLSVSPH